MMAAAGANMPYTGFGTPLLLLTGIGDQPMKVFRAAGVDKIIEKFINSIKINFCISISFLICNIKRDFTYINQSVF